MWAGSIADKLDAPPRPRASSRIGAAGPARIVTFADLDSAASAWRDLERQCPRSGYQSLAFARAWCGSWGTASGAQPAIVTAFDQAGAAVALLPFCLTRRGPLRILSFIGGKDANLNLGLLRPDLDWQPEILDRLVRAGARQAAARADIALLANQPVTWAGRSNPLAGLPGQPSASYAYKTDLDPDPELFLSRRLSREARRKLRQKLKWLGQAGPVACRRAVSPDERRAVLDALIAQKTARGLERGYGAGDTAMLRRFVDRLLDAEGSEASLHGLWCGDRIVATFLGVTAQGRFSGMINTFSPSGDLTRTSPGDLMLAALVSEACRAGLDSFDLGIGEARYKQAYCPEPEPLVDVILPLTARGQMVAVAERIRRAAKRRIKQSPLAFGAALRLRSLAAGLKPDRRPRI